jgi:hypothetical protein
LLFVLLVNGQIISRSSILSIRYLFVLSAYFHRMFASCITPLCLGLSPSGESEQPKTKRCSAYSF